MKNPTTTTNTAPTKPQNQEQMTEEQILNIDEKKPEAEGEGQQEESKEETKTEAAVSRPFDPEKDGRSWDSIDLASMLM